MRSLLLLLLLVTALACGGMLIALWSNGLPWGDPPGRLARLETYLTEHVAQTSDQAQFPELRPRRYPGVSADQLFQAVERAVAGLGWAVLQRAPTERVVRTVVTSRVLLFQYDVEIAVTAASGVGVLNARSVSRVGQGDLGMNEGNLLTLYRAVDDALRSTGAPRL